MLSAVIASLLAAAAWAQDLPGISFSSFERDARSPALKAQEARRKAPDFLFLSLRTGELVTLRDTPEVRRQVRDGNGVYRQDLPVRVLAGSPVLVYFWAPYCKKPCQDAMDVMQSLWEKWGERLWVVGLGLYGPNEDVTGLTGKYSHHVGRYEGNAAQALGLNRMPAWALIDKDGVVFVASDKGVDEADLSNRIRELAGR